MIQTMYDISSNFGHDFDLEKESQLSSPEQAWNTLAISPFSSVGILSQAKTATSGTMERPPKVQRNSGKSKGNSLTLYYGIDGSYQFTLKNAVLPLRHRFLNYLTINVLTSWF